MTTWPGERSSFRSLKACESAAALSGAASMTSECCFGGVRQAPVDLPVLADPRTDADVRAIGRVRGLSPARPSPQDTRRRWRRTTGTLSPSTIASTPRQMERWAVSQAARVEILDRLLEETISAPRWKPRRSPLVAVARVADRSRPIRNRSSGERAGRWGAHRRGRSPPGSRRSRLVASRCRSRVRSAARRGGRGTGRLA